MEEVSGVAEPC
ncbi:hypothetical protein MZH52_24920 [Escherichia coli]|nr:hypothetical protein [Escherichia coli]MCK3624266.1 hypothetical protein [Escherichia coli]MCN2764661.1 hypothetical protein [Escherichia coli]